MPKPRLHLAPDFQFSQSSLQDYADCARRFQLRYLERVAWPAPQAQPIREHEARIERGQRFHQLVQQQLLGIPEEKLTAIAAADPDLSRWWAAFRAARPADIAGRRFMETTLAAAITGHRLLAKYDLVVIAQNAATICDWKTAFRPQKREKIAALFERLQTRVYRYLLVRAGADLNGGRPFAPEQVTMIYWFAESPDAPVEFPYNADQYTADERVLTTMIAEIHGLDPTTHWNLTTQEQQCAYCPYRSLCERGIEAGEINAQEDFELPEVDAFDLDFDQIAEIAF